MGTSPQPKTAVLANAETSLRITYPDGRTQNLPIFGPSWRLGRASDNEFSCPEDAGLSRHHFILEHLGEKWTLRDAGSKNGTFLNGERIQGIVPLKSDDLIAVSNLTLIFDPRKTPTSTCSLYFDPKKGIGDFKHSVSTSLDSLLSQEISAREEIPETPFPLKRSPLDLFRRAGRELSFSRPIEELFQVVLDLAIEAVGADRGILLTKEGESLLVQASRGDNFRISSTVRDRVLEERSSLLLEDVLQDETFRAVESIVAQHVLSLMAVPLQTDERVLGMIYVDSAHPGRHFSREDLELLTIMANVAAIRIERQRLIEIEAAQRRMAAELEQAAEIQRQFLPTQAPEVPGLELSGYNVSCRAVGGDYYDYLLYPDGRVGVLIGDVCGKGLPAALLMMSFQSRVQVLAEVSHSPAELAGRLNRVLTANQLGYRFISFFFCFIHPETGRLLYTNAGHNPPILLHASGEVERLDRGGPVLGILPGAGYEEGTCQLDPLDLLLLYSDGITEANSPDEEEFGEGRLLTILRQNCHFSAEEISSRIVDEVQAWMGGTHSLDDITVVLIRRSGPS